MDLHKGNGSNYKFVWELSAPMIGGQPKLCLQKNGTEANLSGNKGTTTTTYILSLSTPRVITLV